MSRLLAAQRALTVPGWVKEDLSRKAQAIPSLDLRFAENKSLVDATTGANLVTFTRASSGTYVGSDGVLKTATTNLLLRSEEFDNASWVKTGLTVTANSDVSPDGQTTADTLTIGGTGQSIYQSATVTASTSYTGSVYVKLGTLAGANYKVAVYDNTNAAFIATDVVPTQTPTSTGWTRISYTFTTPATCTSVRWYPFRNSGNVSGTAFVWGAQLEQSSTVGEYIPTTSTINSAPRFDHNPTTGESLGLLVEEQRTNSIRNNTMVGAVAGTPGTAPTNWTITSSATGLTKEIVGTGTESGITYIDVRYSGTSTSAGSLQFSADTTTGVPALTGQTWTGSSYVRLVGGTLPGAAAWVWLERDSGGAIVVSGSGGSVSVTQDALNSQRRTTTRTLSGGATVANLSLRIDVTVPNTTAVDVTLRIGLPQLEQGAFATSVIPTSGTAATRSADVASITGTNFSSWYSQSEGTVFADATVLSTSKANQTISFNDSTLNNRFELRLIGAADTYRTDCVAGGVTKFSNQNFASSGTRRIAALSVKANDFRLQSGASGISPASDAVPTVDRLYLNYATFAGGEINGTIRRLCYWGQRLPNSTLQAITQ